MASKQGIARKLGWLLACVCIAGAGCDDDKAADDAHSHGEDGHSHDDEHSHGAAGSDGHAHDRVIGDMTGATCPDGGGTLTYENFGKKFMEDYCLTCHSVDSKDRKMAPADHNFDTLGDVDIMRAHIDQYAGSGPDATNTMMPPAGNPAPSEAERKKLSEWLACGVK